MNIINLTRNRIRFSANDPWIEPEPAAAETETIVHDEGEVAGIPVVIQTYGRLINLPEPVDGTIYLTSQIAAEAAAAHGRYDVYYPAGLVRVGHTVTHCTMLGKPHPSCVLRAVTADS